ncbi:MAG: glycosyltransferase family 2 protein [Cyclobacteriaceae bacterium]
MRVSVIIPAFNEERSISHVVQDIPRDYVDDIIVINNASTDSTAAVAEQAGATVLDEPVPGYGRACLKGIDYLVSKSEKPEIVVFMDGDYSDYPEELPKLVAPICEDGMDLVIGSRAIGNREKGSMTPQQVFGNWLATRILKWKYGAEFTDLGPFRAIRYDRLIDLNMQDKNYGWTVEMQLRAAVQGLKYTEVPVRYRKRIGTSKVSGTLKGTVMAGYKILWTLFTYG